MPVTRFDESRAEELHGAIVRTANGVTQTLQAAAR
jgi:hypothetical protein